MTNVEIAEVLRELNYEVTKSDSQCVEAWSTHKWDTVADKCISAKGKRKLNINNAKDLCYLGIREDGDTRTVFSGYITSLDDLRTIDRLTKIM
jgi:hypothetical protein